MKKILSVLLTLLISFTAAVYSQPAKMISIIPAPAKMERSKGTFKFSAGTKIWFNGPAEELQKLGDLLASAVNGATGFKLSATSKMTGEIPHSLILLNISGDIPGGENYALNINPKEITITAGSSAGVFYALQSLFQMFPSDPARKDLSVQCVSIEDSPRFKWRGVHLDVCRHFFSAAFVKKYIDVLAMYKMNRFHWHLTDDQGWRIEIKKYPRLTGTGAWRKESAGDGKRHGGYYTQEQIKEIVDYAKERFITVVPEIEMPGHALAALASYPELSCTGGPFEVETTWGVFDDVFCAGNDKVFDFLEDVLTEVTALFPSEYIHIGGDECPKERWKVCEKCKARIKTENLKDEYQLQSYFVQRIEKFLNSKGRKIIGWDEILEGGLAPNAAVMSWRGTEGGLAAAKAGHNVVMSPGTHCYFDHYQGLNGEPKSIGGYTNLEKVYSFEPVPEGLSETEAKFIMGAQANLWTEYIETSDHVEYMLLPRLCALSEVLWSPKASRQFASFQNRMMKHYDILASKNYNFRVPTPIDESGEYLLINRNPIVFKKPAINSNIFYTLDGSEPGTQSKVYSAPLKISRPVLIKAKTVLKNGKSSPTVTMYVSVVDTSRNGLNYKYYENFWETLPDFDSLIPARTGKVYKLDLKEFKTRADGYGLAIDGFLKIDKAGEYSFFLTSDDGSRFFIDNKKLIDNDGPHSNKTAEAKLNLEAGKHPVKILYFENAGSQNLKLEYEGPGIGRMPVPASVFFIK